MIISLINFIGTTIEPISNKKEVIYMAQQKKKKRYKRDEALYNTIQENEWFFFFKTLPELVHSAVGNVDFWLHVGRPPTKAHDVLTCLAIWQRFPNISARSAKGFLEFLKHFGVISIEIPCFKTLCNYQANERVRYYLDRLIEISSKPLKVLETCFATDMNGVRTNNFSSWYSIRTNKIIRKRDHLASHVTTGVKSNIVTAVNINVKKGKDNIIMREHVKKTSKNFEVKEWSGDGADQCRENCTAVEEAGGKPYFKLKSNVTTRPEGHPAWKHMVVERKTHPTRYKKHYHKRSNVESTNASKKRRLGSCVRSKLDIAREQEEYIKWVDYNLLVLNRAFFEWNIEPNFYT